MDPCPTGCGGRADRTPELRQIPPAPIVVLAVHNLHPTSGRTPATHPDRPAGRATAAAQERSEAIALAALARWVWADAGTEDALAGHPPKVRVSARRTRGVPCVPARSLPQTRWRS